MNFRHIAAAALAGAMFLCSCSREGAVQQCGSVDARFSVSAGNGAKASFDLDGQAACVKRFVMEIWASVPGSASTRLYDRQVVYSDTPIKETSFDVTLVKSQTYDILFWADNASSAVAGNYYDASDLHDVKFLSPYKGNDDARDAFSKAIRIQATDTSIWGSVVLTRPFAQVNFITADIARLQALGGASYSIPDSLEIAYEAASSFNVLDGTLGGKTTVRSGVKPYYSTTGNKGEGESRFTLTMDYILAGTEQSTETFTLSAYNSGNKLFDSTFDNIPLRRNYRTNVIGNLLTESGTFTIVVDENWNDPEYVVSL